MERIILHCDLNCFFASVELLSHPELQSQPVAVCGDPQKRHGIILAKNEAAKKCGVQTAETIWQARQKCPDLICLPPHHDLYREYSRKVNAIYLSYTDLVEPFGIDESWLDLTGSLHLFGNDAKAVADEIRHRVRQELGLTLSVGVSFNKIFAKLGSDYKKPDATTVISPENWKKIVFPLPAGDLLFVGRAASRVLAQYGVHTIGQLSAFPEESLVQLFGKMGHQLHSYACGLDDSPVRPPELQGPVKSVGNGSTFPQNITQPDEARLQLHLLSDQVAMRLRAQNLVCNGVQLTIRSASFQTISRQKNLPHSTALMREISQAAMELLTAVWHFPQPIRMLTVTAIHLTDAQEAFCQVSLFDGSSERQKKLTRLETTVDRIRGRFGSSAISYGGQQSEHKEKETDE